MRRTRAGHIRSAVAMGFGGGWLAALLAACAPTMHKVERYASDPARAAQLQARARAICEQSPGGPRKAPDKPFITDGCSLWLDRDWSQDCCVDHDISYWCGGSAAERERADRELRTCIARQAPSWIARLVYWGVRAGGHPIFPLHFRWGFGRSYLPWHDRPKAPCGTPPQDLPDAP